MTSNQVLSDVKVSVCIKTADYNQIVFKMKFKTSFFLFIISFYDVVKILLNVRQVFLKDFHGH